MAKRKAKPTSKPKVQSTVMLDGSEAAVFYGDASAKLAATFVAGLPKGDRKKVTVETRDRSLRITAFIEQDSDVRAPDEDCDGQWKLYAFDRNVNHHAEPTSLGLTGDWDENGEPEFTTEWNGEEGDASKDVLTEDAKTLKAKLEEGLAYFLSYSEHGECSWDINEAPKRSRGVNFDRRTVGGLLVWEHDADDMGAKTPEDRKKDAERFLETFNEWANGHCYGYRCEDEDGDDVEDASCWGFYGNDLDYMFENLRGSLPEGAEIVRFEGDSADMADYHDKPTKAALAERAKAAAAEREARDAAKAKVES